MSNKYLELLDLPTFKENIVKKIQDLLEEHKDNTRHVPDGGNPANFLGLNEEGVPAWIELNKSWFVTYTGDTTTSVDLSEQFMDEWSYGVEFPEGTISTPNKLTRIGKSEYHKTLPIQSNLRGCVEQNGVVQYYLNEKDWTADTKDFDGNVITPRLDGYDGDVAIDT
jgi:hypothetical protein